jgi:CBS-domain-containing membrane protein
MEENGLRAVPVVSDSGFEGMVSYRELIRAVQFDPESTGLENVMHQPPEFSPDDTLVDLCDLRIESGRKTLVNTSGGELVSIVGDAEFADALGKADELEDISTSGLVSNDVVSVFKRDSIEKARHEMLDNNISRLPVLDSDGKLNGILRSTDILELITDGERQGRGGRTSRRDAVDINTDYDGEKHYLSGVSVEELMEREYQTFNSHASASRVLDHMSSGGFYEAIYVDGRYPEAILTLKDLIESVANLKQDRTVLVNLVGLEVAEEKAAVHDKVKTQLRGGLGRKLERPEELRLRFKKSETDGVKHRYTVEASLFSEHGRTNTEVEDRDMLDAVDTVLDNLDSQIRE